jgi:trans-2,3-dihydro-3-hydroxyanthranilate isomerase
VRAPLYIVDAFTDRPFAGNPAGVVTRAEGLSSEQMLAIARELRHSESCFVTESPDPGVDFRLRWFTPAVEVDLCGHATVAAYSCLAEEGRISFREGGAHLKYATRRGVLSVWVEGEGRKALSVMMSAGVAPIAAAPDDREAVARAIGLAPPAMDEELPVAVDSASARLIVPVLRLEELLSLTPDYERMRSYGEAMGYSRFTLICRETKNPRLFTHLRHFAPGVGVAEDPVTGTAHATIAVYLDWLGLLPAGERVAYEGEQGQAVGRPGSVNVEVLRRDGTVADVRIGGKAVIVVRGEIET